MSNVYLEPVGWFLMAFPYKFYTTTPIHNNHPWNWIWYMSSNRETFGNQVHGGLVYCTIWWLHACTSVFLLHKKGLVIEYERSYYVHVWVFLTACIGYAYLHCLHNSCLIIECKNFVRCMSNHSLMHIQWKCLVVEGIKCLHFLTSCQTLRSL